MTTHKFADNLTEYMDNSESGNTLTLADLDSILARMAGDDSTCETGEYCADVVK